MGCYFDNFVCDPMDVGQGGVPTIDWDLRKG
jgi:hypothetical protein